MRIGFRKDGSETWFIETIVCRALMGALFTAFFLARFVRGEDLQDLRTRTVEMAVDIL